MNEPSLRKAVEGKTKAIYQYTNHPHLCVVESSDRISGGDGKRKDVIPGKGALSNRTTCNVFRLLERHGLPLAFINELGPNKFFAEYTEMIPLEVVTRGFARGSYRKRHPEVPLDTPFTPPIVELYLKTTGKKWKGIELPCDDPILEPIDKHNPENGFRAYRPDEPVSGKARTPCVPLVTFKDLGLEQGELRHVEHLGRETFVVLQPAFAKEKGRLIDMKEEVGRSVATGELLISDVVDNDSWRVVFEGVDVSKQGYRDGDDLETVKSRYEFVAKLTDSFRDN